MRSVTMCRPHNEANTTFQVTKHSTQNQMHKSDEMVIYDQEVTEGSFASVPGAQSSDSED